MITTAATASNIRRLLRHTHGIAYQVEHNLQGTPPHHGFSLVISVEWTCVEHYPWVYCTR